jgi:plasmid stabilization system protein ParE
VRGSDVEVALRVDQKIEEALDAIAANPTIGHTRVDLGIPENLLIRAVYSYLVIYNPKTRPVRIPPYLARSPGEARDSGSLSAPHFELSLKNRLLLPIFHFARAQAAAWA